MNLRTTVEDQMASPSLCLFRNQLPWILVLVSLLIIYGFLGFGCLSVLLLLLTCLVLVMSTIYFTFSKQKPLPVDKIEEEVTPKAEHSSSNFTASKLHPEIETIAQKKEDQGSTSMNKIGDYLVRLPDEPKMDRVISILQPEREITTENKAAEEAGMSQVHENLIGKSTDSISENESVEDSSTSEDSETEWHFQDNMNQSSVCSDGSISDEDSLIEIALPTGHYVSSNEEEPKFNLQQKMPDFMAKSIFQQHSSSLNLMEVLAEINDMNEEENLIEIDISMGSIKCSRFEIEA